MKNIVYYLFLGTRGGETRALIAKTLKQQPLNAHQLSRILALDYKTIQHHLRILLDNNILTAVNKGKYGAVYFISPEMSVLWKDFRQILEKVGKINLKH
jgi:DNA-binding transcriptional ArsR family regulator